jgi:hypothetical protein
VNELEKTGLSPAEQIDLIFKVYDRIYVR